MSPGWAGSQPSSFRGGDAGHRHAGAAPDGGRDVAEGDALLATINQLAVVAGIAIAGTIYLAAAHGGRLAPMTAVLATIAAALAATGTGLVRK